MNNKIIGNAGTSINTKMGARVVSTVVDVTLKDIATYMTTYAKVQCPFTIELKEADPAGLYASNEDVPDIKHLVAAVTGYAKDNTYIAYIPVMRVEKAFVEDTTSDPVLIAAGVKDKTLNINKCKNEFTTPFAEERSNDEVDIMLKSTVLLTKVAIDNIGGVIPFSQVLNGKYSVAIQFNKVDGFTVIFNNNKYTKTA